MNALAPLPLALPCPAWHTADVYELAWRSGARSFFKWLYSMSPEQLFELLEDHRQFRDAFFPPSGRYRNESVSIGRHLPHEEWMRVIKLIDAVKQAIEHELLDRYCTEISRRKEAAHQAARTRARKKASAKAFDARSNEVSAPFSRRAA
jgi:hypothetical protein